ncbi:zinc finger and BTB domain-containing protein 45-like [Dreissena polymorpha]|uniref:zinc finger and BTB domain-containing protein 45-like n=1 Tax=Dreissena polymorpha TaxID=45954 RepID=UPI0022648960|nr:zinc finger and BTB domain-containing protein 45-like [Dreissena polymorpha]XP_052256416.1 zinc finger and BTB domain-containing protein 45-like [Dreissena polymorpha]
MSEPKQTRLLRDGEKYQLGNSLMYGKQLLDQLHGQMQAQSDYCDVTVRCCDTDMKAHWCVLAAAPYFQSLYNSGLQEKQQGRNRH